MLLTLQQIYRSTTVIFHHFCVMSKTCLLPVILESYCINLIQNRVFFGKLCLPKLRKIFRRILDVNRFCLLERILLFNANVGQIYTICRHTDRLKLKFRFVTLFQFLLIHVKYLVLNQYLLFWSRLFLINMIKCDCLKVCSTRFVVQKLVQRLSLFVFDSHTFVLPTKVIEFEFSYHVLTICTFQYRTMTILNSVKPFSQFSFVFINCLIIF